MTMTSLERYNAVLAGRSPDIVPRVPILMQFAAEYIGSNYGAFASDWRVLVEANRRCAEDFGMDQVSVISDPYRETQGFGGVVEYVTDGVPRCPHPPLSTHKDLARLERPDPLRSERMLDRVNAVRGFKESLGDQYSILGWVEGAGAEAADLRGVSRFMMELRDAEPCGARLLDRCLEVGVEFARAQLEAGADTIGIGEAIASQVSPDIYERLLLPRALELAGAIHDAGGKVRLHICGNITHLLPMIAELECEIVDVDHMVRMRDVRRALGSRTVLAGNVNPVEVFNTDPPAIRARLLRARAEAGEPWMAAAGCEIPSGTPERNLRALCEPIRD